MATEATATTPTTPAAPATTPATTPETAPDPLTVDIQAAIEKARNDEKNKMYSRVERAETDAKAASQALAEAQLQLKSLTETVERLSKGGTKETTPDENKPAALSPETVQAMLEKQATALFEKAEKEIFGPRIAALTNESQALKKQLEARDLDAYRKSLIEKNQAQIIPELVQGSTKDELDTSLTLAKQAFARIADTLTRQTSQAAATASGTVPPLPATNPATTSPSSPAVTQLSDKEYQEKRAQYLREASEAMRTIINTNQ